MFAQRLAVPPALPAAHHVDLELDGGLIREDLRAVTNQVRRKKSYHLVI